MKWVHNGLIENAPPGDMGALPDAVGIYETLLVRERTLIFPELHWERLVGGAHLQQLGLPFDRATFLTLTLDLLRENELRDGVCRVALWVSEVGRVTWRIEVSGPRPHMGRSPWRVKDGGAILPPVARDHVCKHLRRTVWMQALRAARAEGWDEVLLADGYGHLVEGGAANVFFVRAGVLHTPSLAVGPLPGVMRAQMLAFSRAQGWRVEEGVYPVTELDQASEIWMTNSLIGIRPVVAWGGRELDAEMPWLTRWRRSWEVAHGWDPVVVLPAGA